MWHRPSVAASTLLSLLLAASAAGQTASPPPTPDPDEWKITDNSFLVEEAFNQDPGIVQHIFGFQKGQGGTWQFTFTQEWPAPNVRHQLSYTIPAQGSGGTNGFGDILINYRLQVLEEGPGRPAFAPRISAILPSGSTDVGAGTHGVQINLPFSKHRGDWYFHWNGGFTWQRGDGPSLLSPAVAGSVIYRARQMLNLMLEAVVQGQDLPLEPNGPGTGQVAQRFAAVTISPGVRGGWNVTDDKQIVIGVAAPIGRTQDKTSGSVFLYFSYEGPVKGLPRK